MGRQARAKKQRREARTNPDTQVKAEATVKAAPEPATGAPIHVNDATFDAEVLGSDIPVLVDFWAPWCGPCKALGPHIDALAEARAGEVKVVKYNTQQSNAVASQMGIRSIPTMVIFKGGEVADVKIGALPPASLGSWVDGIVNPKPSLWKRLTGGATSSAAAS